MSSRAVPLAALALMSCGLPPLPEPSLGPHLDEEPLSVPGPPPPGKVEVIPPPPPKRKRAVWIDGAWDWQGRRWRWKEGRWETPPSDSAYAPPLFLRLLDGSQVYFNGGWKKQPAEPKTQ